MRLEYLELIDEVVALDAAGGTLRARSRLPMESPVFEGHFPGAPLVPGTMLTEIMAQACGFLILKRLDFARLPVLMAIDRARFRAYVGPGAGLEIAMAVETEGSGYVAASAEIRSDGGMVADAALRFRLAGEFGQVLAILRARAEALGLIGAEGP